MKLKRPLRGGEKGADVRMVQRALNRWAASRDFVAIPVTRKYDQTTGDRVMVFQGEQAIKPASGALGQATLTALWPYFDAFGRASYRLFRLPEPAPPNPFAKERCRERRAAHDSGARTARSIRLVVIHSAESESASGVASFFSRPSTQASTQLAVDVKECWRMVPDLVIPWGAAGANSDGLHIEICGRAKWNRFEWLAREPMLRRAAWYAARWCWTYGIDAEWLADRDLANGTARGLVTHAQVNRVFKRGHHWDPGPDFPADLFIRWVAEYVEQIRAERDR